MRSIGSGVTIVTRSQSSWKCGRYDGANHGRTSRGLGAGKPAVASDGELRFIRRRLRRAAGVCDSVAESGIGFTFSGPARGPAS